MLTMAAVISKTAAERFREIPVDFWIRFGVGVAVLVLLVVVLRKVARMNKLVLGGIVFLTVSFVGFTWIYERNEPAWASPAVSWVAGFFPSKAHLNH